MAKIIYEPHPVSVERKKELRERGYRIVDAQFAPKGYEHPDGSRSDRDNKALTVAQIKDALTEKGIEIPEGAKKAELQALLDAATQADQQ